MVSTKTFLKVTEYNKYIFYCFLALLIITSTILLCKTSSILNIYGNYKVFVHSSFLIVPGLLSTLSIVILTIASIGWITVTKQSNWMIFVTIVAIGIISGIELGGAFGSFNLVHFNAKLVEDRIRNTLPLYNRTARPDVVQIWDIVHEQFQCCGVDSVYDWPPAIGAIPMSCCTVPSEPINQTMICIADMEYKYLHKTGCFRPFDDFIAQYEIELGTIAIVFSSLQLIGACIIFACYMIKIVCDNRNRARGVISTEKGPDYIAFI